MEFVFNSNRNNKTGILTNRNYIFETRQGLTKIEGVALLVTKPFCKIQHFGDPLIDIVKVFDTYKLMFAFCVNSNLFNLIVNIC